MLVHVSVYGERHASFLPALLNSIAVNWPEAKVHIDYSNISYETIELFRGILPDALFRFVNFPSVDSSDHSFRASQNIQLRYSFLSELKYGTEVFFIDADMLVYQNPSKYLRDLGKQDIVFTHKQGIYPLNTAVMLVRKNSRTLELFRRCVALSQKLIKEALSGGTRIFEGAPDQSAFLELLDIDEYLNKGLEDIKIVAARDLKLSCKLIPCEALNQTESLPLSPKTYLYHVKSGWHKVLLDGENFGEKRPKFSSLEILELWKYHNISGLRKGLVSYIEKQLHQTNQFRNKIQVPYQEGGIFPSEMVLVCLMLNSLNIDLVVESGRRNGFSTEYMASELIDSNIVSFELSERNVNPTRESSLSTFANVSLKFGNAEKSVPKMLRKTGSEMRNQNIGLIIDGPKGLRAIRLAHKLIRQNDSIKCVFIHDMKWRVNGRLSLARVLADNVFDRIVFSDEVRFPKKVLNCDSHLFTQEKSRDSWRPYMKWYENTQSYGPTLAVVVPSSSDRNFKRRWVRMVLSLDLWSRLGLLKRFLFKGPV